MPRDGRPARRRLRRAALDLYAEHGFDQVTTAEIAARAEVTERTFYRHFADKREVLFDGEAALRDSLRQGVEQAPAALGPLATLQWTFRRVLPLLEEDRSFSQLRYRLVSSTPALRERQRAKAASLVQALAEALHRRGVAGRLAPLAAWTGMSAFEQAVRLWIEQTAVPLDSFLTQAFDDLHALCSDGAAAEAAARDRGQAGR